MRDINDREICTRDTDKHWKNSDNVGYGPLGTDSMFERFLTGVPSSEAYKIAENAGLVVFKPNDRELTIDIDGGSTGLDLFWSQLHRIRASGVLVDVMGVRVTKSAGGKNHHAIVTTKYKHSLEERILYQLLLGSDQKRELYSLARIRQNDPAPSLLFMPKEVL